MRRTQDLILFRKRSKKVNKKLNNIFFKIKIYIKYKWVELGQADL